MTDKIALVFHMNLDHSGLSREESLKLIHENLEKMLERISVPINMSSTARDWELINHLNPKLLEKIKNHEMITVLDGIYTHAILTHFPEFMVSQVDIGHKVHEMIFGESLSPYGLVPEFGFDSSNLDLLVSKWSGNIASSAASIISRIYPSDYNGFRNSREYNASTLNAYDSKGRLHPVNIAKRSKLNPTINKFFRGVNDPIHILNNLRSLLDKSDEPFVVYVHDFESPLINKAMMNGVKKIRIDKWFDFLETLEKSGVQFIPLDNKAYSESKDYANKKEVVYALVPRDKTKWLERTNNYDLHEGIRRTARRENVQENYWLKSLLQTMGSDTFSVLNRVGKDKVVLDGRVYLPEKKKYARVDIVFNECDPMRYIETVHLLKSINEGKSVNQDIGQYPIAQQQYFNALHNIFLKS